MNEPLANTFELGPSDPVWDALFVGFVSALGKSDLTDATMRAQSAINLSVGLGWLHLTASVHLLLGAALAGLNRHDEAMASYSETERVQLAAETQCAGPSLLRCRQLALSARLNRGASLMVLKKWDVAAFHYLETAPVAHGLGEAAAHLECYRLASFSYEQDGKDDDAWSAGLSGLEVARAMPPAQRSASTFPQLSEALIRLGDKESRRDQKRDVEREIEKLNSEQSQEQA